ncbi:MAG: malonyl-CoA decarboxylase [Acidimicrobiales bacterium]
MHFLLDEMGPSRSDVDSAIKQYRAVPSQLAMNRLAQAVEARRQPLFRSINTAPGGTWTILSMRADILTVAHEHPELAPVEADLVHILSSWFNRGFIVLERISWRSPGAVLERLIQYEAVHEIRGWHDLRRRLEADRRCFGFFHPAIADQPLIFIEVALRRDEAWSIQEVLDAPVEPDDEESANTAIFYSITNCQAGLRGIPLGSFLIKQVVQELKAELPGLKHFWTLSPVPSFARWLATSGIENFTAAERSVLDQLSDPAWIKDPERSETVKPILLRACARYLVTAKRHTQPADPVARFHLRNGATLQRINWLGDTSPKGLKESHGLLVNYVYDEGQIDTNHDAFVHNGLVARSSLIDQLLK